VKPTRTSRLSGFCARRFPASSAPQPPKSSRSPSSVWSLPTSLLRAVTPQRAAPLVEQHPSSPRRQFTASAMQLLPEPDASTEAAQPSPLVRECSEAADGAAGDRAASMARTSSDDDSSAHESAGDASDDVVCRTTVRCSTRRGFIQLGRVQKRSWESAATNVSAAVDGARHDRVGVRRAEGGGQGPVGKLGAPTTRTSTFR
jgi:hypothetical protein